MSNKTKINRLLEEYILLAHDYFIKYNESQPNKVCPLKSKKDRIVEAVANLESLTVFNELVSITWDEYIETFFEGREVNDYGFPLIDIYIHWRYLVKNFFRRSGIYIDMFNDDFIDIDKLIQLYYDSFTMREAKVRYLAPLELTDFSVDERIDFKTFSIRKFSEDELEKILDNNINNIFYPWAVWDVKKLSMLWFVDITVYRKISSNILGSRVFYDLGGDSFSSCEADDFVIKNKPSYESIPEHILKILVLFDWNYYRQKSIAQGFKLPFVLVLDDYFLIYPKRAVSNYILPSTITVDMIETDYGDTVINNIGFKPLHVFKLNELKYR